jgi:hypothetical protein
MTPGRSPLILTNMKEKREDRPIREEEARYLVIQIANQHPKLDGLLIAARLQSRPWAEILKILQEATTAGMIPALRLAKT